MEKQNFVTGSGTLVFDKNLFTADEKGKFGCAIVLPKESISKELREYVDALAAESKVLSKTKKWKKPYKPFDYEPIIEKRPDLDGQYVINMSTKFQFPVVDRTAEEITRDDIGAGDKIRASISFYEYSVDGNKGIATNVNGIQLVEKGERLFNKPTGKTIFSGFVEEAQTEDLEDDEF